MPKTLSDESLRKATDRAIREENARALRGEPAALDPDLVAFLQSTTLLNEEGF
jgi:hypothetical protein